MVCHSTAMVLIVRHVAHCETRIPVTTHERPTHVVCTMFTDSYGNDGGPVFQHHGKASDLTSSRTKVECFVHTRGDKQSVMSDAPSPALSEAAQAVADSKIPPGDDYEEIREQVRHLSGTKKYREVGIPSLADALCTGFHRYHQDRYLPIANIARIMKNTLPENAKIAKDSKETVQECVSEFISFITSEASDKCLQEKRKTINGDDLLWAMSTLGFDKYVEPLKIYLNKYREAVRGDKPDKSRPSMEGDQS